MDRRLELLEILGITEGMLLKVVQGKATIDYHEKIGSIDPFGGPFRNASLGEYELFGRKQDKPGSPIDLNTDTWDMGKFGDNKDINGKIIKVSPECNSVKHEESVSTEEVKHEEPNVVVHNESEFDKTDEPTLQLDMVDKNAIFDLDTSTKGWSKVQTETIEEVDVVEEVPEDVTVKTPIQNNTGSEDIASPKFSGGWGTTPMFTKTGDKSDSIVDLPDDKWMRNPWENKK